MPIGPWVWTDDKVYWDATRPPPVRGGIRRAIARFELAPTDRYLRDRTSLVEPGEIRNPQRISAAKLSVF